MQGAENMGKSTFLITKEYVTGIKEKCPMYSGKNKHIRAVTNAGVNYTESKYIS